MKYSSLVRKKNYGFSSKGKTQIFSSRYVIQKVVVTNEPIVSIRYVPNLDNIRIREEGQITFMLYDKSDEYFSVKEKLKKLFCEISLNLKGQ